jgi:hypothetical protein
VDKGTRKETGTELEKWADDQHIPLTISVKTSNGWKEIQKIKSIGPLLTRDVVIPVDLTVMKPPNLRYQAVTCLGA